MEKTLPKIGKHTAGLEQEAPPPEFAEQQAKIKDIAAGKKYQELSNRAVLAEENNSNVRPTTKVKLTCKTITFTIEVQMYAMDLTVKWMHLLLASSCPLRDADKLEFVVEIEGHQYPVMFFGSAAEFPDVHMISFARIPENK